MKNLRYPFILVISFAIVTLAGCVSTPEKNVIEYAENMIIDPELLRNDICYLDIKQGIHILTIDISDYEPGQSFIPAGNHLLCVQYNDGKSFSDPVFLSFIFEKEKSYYLDYEITAGVTSFSNNTIRFFIRELMDPYPFKEAKERLAAYLVFSTANPNYLDGTWERVKYPMKPVQVTFDGSRIIFKRITNFRTTTEVIEGRYIFDEKTIIIFPDSYVINGKESTFDLKLGQRKQIVWYYELKDNVFNIIKAPWIGSSLTYDSINGLYNKNNN